MSDMGKGSAWANANEFGQRQKERAEEAERKLKDALESLRTLVEHAGEKYPHFESERGQKEIAEARALLTEIGG